MTRAVGPGAFLFDQGPGALEPLGPGHGALVPLTGQQTAGAIHCHVVGRRAKTAHAPRDHGPKAVGREKGHEAPERCSVAPLGAGRQEGDDLLSGRQTTTTTRRNKANQAENPRHQVSNGQGAKGHPPSGGGPGAT